MTTEEARQHLEAADKGLSGAIGQLVALRVGQLDTELQEAAEAIKKVYDHRASFRNGEPLGSLLQNIQTRVARVQILLDASATFYCGAISAAALQTGSYTPQGEMPRGDNGGHLKLEA